MTRNDADSGMGADSLSNRRLAEETDHTCTGMVGPARPNRMHSLFFATFLPLLRVLCGQLFFPTQYGRAALSRAGRPTLSQRSDPPEFRTASACGGLRSA
jgi:hypothetical protein